MKVKGINQVYDVEIKEVFFDKKEGVEITVGNIETGMTTVIISMEDWLKIKAEV